MSTAADATSRLSVCPTADVVFVHPNVCYPLYPESSEFYPAVCCVSIHYFQQIKIFGCWQIGMDQDSEMSSNIQFASLALKHTAPLTAPDLNPDFFQQALTAPDLDLLSCSMIRRAKW